MEKGFFDNPIMRTKVTSANVKAKEALLGYFIGPFIAFISNAIFSSYLNRYYTDVIGLTSWAPRFAMLMPMVSVIFVIIGNLAIGRLIDMTRTPQGKARPYLLLSAPLVVLAIVLLFLAPRDGSLMTLVWIMVSYNLYYAVAYPFFYTSHSSMVALSTRNSKHRGLLATFSNAAGVAAVGIGASIVFPLFQGLLFVTRDGGVDAAASYNAWRSFVIVLCIITFLGIVLEYYFTRERITEENRKLNIREEKLSMMKQLKAVVSSRYWWLIMLYFLLFQFGGLIKNGSMTYYCRWMFGAVDEAAAGGYQATLGLIGGLPTAVGMILAWPIADKLGKQRAVVAGMFISVLGGLVSFIDVHSFILVCAGVVLKGVGSIPAMYVTLALLSDVLDHLEAKNGFRSDGFTMSVYGAVMVGMTGLGSGIINAFLGIGGYNASLAVQSEATQNALIICYLVIELVCYAVIAVMLIFLTVEKHVARDQEAILEHQRKMVLAAGGEWIEPAKRLLLEQEEADRQAEEARITELKARCARKGLSFEEEEEKYQAKRAARKEKAERRKK
ncbi:MAG TPA: MFS transporter [Clostridiales bacterium]|nr:MFS transporter [Clostridiales bacterium]